MRFAPRCLARRSRSSGLSLLLCGLALAACQVRPLGAQEVEEEAVRAANHRFVRAEGLRDPDSLRAVFWQDAVLQPASGRRLEGHEAILAFYARRARASEARAASSEPVNPTLAPAAPARDTTQPRAPSGLRISAAGDMAVVWGPGESGTYCYNFMTILERRDGEWKVLVNSWNIRPAPATTPPADTTGRSNYRLLRPGLTGWAFGPQLPNVAGGVRSPAAEPQIVILHFVPDLRSHCPSSLRNAFW